MFRIDPKIQFQESLGRRIKQVRQEKKIKSKDLAAKLGVQPSYFCDVEAGLRNISAYLLWRVEKELGQIPKDDFKCE